MSLTPQGLSFLAYITAGGGFVVSRIIRKAKLEVSEGGLELTTNQRSKVENPDIFKVGGPFLFFILHKETKTVLFCGRISTP